MYGGLVVMTMRIAPFFGMAVARTVGLQWAVGAFLLCSRPVGTVEIHGQRAESQCFYSLALVLFKPGSNSRGIRERFVARGSPALRSVASLVLSFPRLYHSRFGKSGLWICFTYLPLFQCALRPLFASGRQPIRVADTVMQVSCQ